MTSKRMLQTAVVSLTDREVQVLQQLAYGYTTSEIGENLYLSSETIKNYRSNLLRKFDCKNSFQLGLYAASSGLVSAMI